MAFPEPSDATAATRGAFWWLATNNGVQSRCSTQGLTVLQALERTLRARLPTLFTAAGVLSLRSDVRIDSQIGPHVLGGMLRMMEDMDAPTIITDGVTHDFQTLWNAGIQTTLQTGTPLSQQTMQAAVWLAYHWNKPFSSLSFPPITPWRYLSDVVDDGASHDLVTCVAVSDGTTTGTSAPAPNQPRTGGVVIATGGGSYSPLAPDPTTNVAVDVSPATTSVWGLVAAVGGAVVTGAGLAWAAFRAIKGKTRKRRH